MAANGNDIASDAEQTSHVPDPSHISLYQDIEARFAKTSLGPERWYLVALAAIAGGTDPESSRSLYLHLCTAANRQDPASRQALVRRLREVLVKSISIYGVCKPIEAIVAINQVERAEDKDHTFTRKGWASSEENHKRGVDWLQKVYAQNLDFTLGLFKDHLDFAWISEDITYGLYLADRQVLDDVETELVVLAGIMIQNLPKQTWWHIRGCRRVGISREDVRVVWDCIQLVAQHAGLKLHRVPTPEEVEADV